LRNIDQHRAMLASQELMARVLRELNTACVVVSSGLGILHANRAALQLFAAPGRRRAGLDFADLPQALGAKVYQVLKTGTGLSAFRHQPDDAPDASYRVSVLPLHTTAQAPPSAALLLVEDLTQTEQLSRLELEASGLRLVQSMAERLAHEIGNAIVPLSTHQQLLQQKYEDPEFRASLAAAMSDSVKRISRLAKQMFFLARERFERSDQVPVKQLVEEAFNDAQNLCAHKLARLQFENGSDPLALAVDHAGVRYALAEVLLNALQAGSGDAPVSVHASPKRDAHGTPWIDIAVRDSGPGFTAADATRATTPFFTTRSVGLGLGLTVARRIIEKHQGTIDNAPSGKEQPSQVVISLPAKS
jgi:signal transduction histidine kinase